MNMTQQGIAAEVPADKARLAGLCALAVGSIGVVYGDIGTSPLYALREAVNAATGPDATPTPEAVYGVLSLILWALIFVVTFKYVIVLLRADNNGEGGTLTLMALARKATGDNTAFVVMLGIIGAALFFGDALITPAISVLSAIEGLKDVESIGSQIEPYIVPITVAILVALFAVEARGTARVASFFGPVMLLWFVAIAVPGVIWIASNPGILLALNPYYGVAFLLGHGVVGLVTLGAVFLAVTGAEALYADLGHFGRVPVQAAWLVLVFPALALNYLGQGALVLANPGAIKNPFFLLYPEMLRLPMVLLATIATVIASQAVITGAYSLTRQAIALGLLPRLEIRHTSEEHEGQIYMPRVNISILTGVLLLVALFRSSSALASAYGIAVTGTMVVTAIMAFIVVNKVWGWSLPATAALIAPFVIVDSTFLMANLLKVIEGWLGAARAGERRDGDHVHVAARHQAAVRQDPAAGDAARCPRRHAGEEAAPARARHRGVPHQRSRQCADRPDAQPQALQGAAREERHPLHRDRPSAARAAGRARAHRAGRADVLPGDAAVRLHGAAERAECARHRPQARLAVRHHVDLVLRVAPQAAPGRALRHAAMAGPAVHFPGAGRERCHRLLPDPHRPRGRGRHASDDLRWSLRGMFVAALV